MREPVRDKNLLEDIIKAVDYATEFVKDFTFEQFVQDKRTYFAVVKNMEISSLAFCTGAGHPHSAVLSVPTPLKNLRWCSV